MRPGGCAIRGRTRLWATLNDAVLQLSADVDAIATAEQKVRSEAQIDAERDLSTSLDFDEVGSTPARNVDRDAREYHHRSGLPP